MAAEFTPIANFGNTGILHRYVNIDCVGIDLPRVQHAAAHVGFSEGVKLDLDWPLPPLNKSMESGRIELTTDAVPTEPAYKLLEAAERVLWMRVDVRNIYNRLDVFNNTAKGDQTVQFASGLHATLGAAIREAYASQPKRTIGKYLITQCLTRTQRLAGIIS